MTDGLAWKGADTEARLVDAGQYHSLCTGAVLVDRSERGRLVVVGADRGPFLNALLTQDLAGLVAGQGTVSTLTDIKGRVLAAMRIWARDQELWIDTEPGVVEGLAAARIAA